MIYSKVQRAYVTIFRIYYKYINNITMEQLSEKNRGRYLKCKAK